MLSHQLSTMFHFLVSLHVHFIQIYNFDTVEIFNRRLRRYQYYKSGGMNIPVILILSNLYVFSHFIILIWVLFTYLYILLFDFSEFVYTSYSIDVSF